MANGRWPASHKKPPPYREGVNLRATWPSKQQTRLGHVACLATDVGGPDPEEPGEVPAPFGISKFSTTARSWVKRSLISPTSAILWGLLTFMWSHRMIQLDVLVVSTTPSECNPYGLDVMLLFLNCGFSKFSCGRMVKYTKNSRQSSWAPQRQLKIHPERFYDIIIFLQRHFFDRLAATTVVN